jgi:hypothetical protein
MSVHKKLMDARLKLQGMELKKSGHNKFAGYFYFELGDFLPAIQTIFAELGLCGVVSYEPDVAKLCITDTDDGTVIVITSPMAEANLKGAHPIQNLGAVETYQRRYLWMTAMEIVEHDAIDASSGAESTKTKAETTAPAPAPVKLEKKEAVATGKAPVHAEGREGPWQIKVDVKAEEDLQAWISIVLEATRLALSTTQSQKDVMDIFKVNRVIFDKLKAEAPEDHTALLADFTTKKNSFGA